MGRPTKLTDNIRTAILKAVANGVPYLQAAALADVSQNTAMEWRARGQGTDNRPPTPLYASFANALKKAEAQDEARRVLRINQAGQGGTVTYEKVTRTTAADGTAKEIREQRRTAPEWQADAWHLERTRPEVYGRRDRVDVTLTLIQQAAQKVADELGMTADEVLSEAQALLAEVSHADRA